MKLTRDSVILKWGAFAGVVAALAANAGAFPAKWQPYISSIATIVATVNGWLMTSVLRGEKDF